MNLASPILFNQYTYRYVIDFVCVQICEYSNVEYISFKDTIRNLSTFHIVLESLHLNKKIQAQLLPEYLTTCLKVFFSKIQTWLVCTCSCTPGLESLFLPSLALRYTTVYLGDYGLYSSKNLVHVRMLTRKMKRK